MLRVFSDERCLRHEVPFGFPEVSERLRRVLDGCEGAGWEVEMGGKHPDVDAAIARIHDADYVRRFERAVARGDGLFCSSDNPVGKATWPAARAAVESALRAAGWMIDGADRTAFAAVRPPGHHAERDVAMGFCFFNNAAIAADYLRWRHGLDRVAVFDLDVHHGNGTQHIFEREPDVLYLSTHQFPFYPGTGARSERGLGDGEGATVNVPLPAGTDDAGFARALGDEILPEIRRFRPGALIVSAGLDAWRGDPLGGMSVSRAGFRAAGERLAELAAEVCSGRVMAILEGGYDLQALDSLAVELVGGLAGEAARRSD